MVLAGLHEVARRAAVGPDLAVLVLPALPLALEPVLHRDALVVPVGVGVDALIDTILASLAGKPIGTNAALVSLVALPIVLALHIHAVINILATISHEALLARALALVARSFIEALDIPARTGRCVALLTLVAIDTNAPAGEAHGPILAAPSRLAVIFFALLAMETRGAHTIALPAACSVLTTRGLARVWRGLTSKACKSTGTLTPAIIALASILAGHRRAVVELAPGSTETIRAFAFAFRASATILARDVGTWISWALLHHITLWAVAESINVLSTVTQAFDLGTVVCIPITCPEFIS